MYFQYSESLRGQPLFKCNFQCVLNSEMTLLQLNITLEVINCDNLISNNYDGNVLYIYSISFCNRDFY